MKLSDVETTAHKIVLHELFLHISPLIMVRWIQSHSEPA